MQHLLDKGIPCAVYYPIPLHSQKAYLDPRYKEEDFPVTNLLAKQVISLPRDESHSQSSRFTSIP
jgi:dTDP-4-amino-4,6-dideoxygalactose transaminase